MHKFEATLALPGILTDTMRRGILAELRSRGVPMDEWDAEKLRSFRHDESLLSDFVPGSGVNFNTEDIVLPERLFGATVMKLLWGGALFDYVEQEIYNVRLSTDMAVRLPQLVAEVESPQKELVTLLIREREYKEDPPWGVVNSGHIVMGPDMPPLVINGSCIGQIQHELREREEPPMVMGLDLMHKVESLWGEDGVVPLGEANAAAIGALLLKSQPYFAAYDG
jgi:hypothetical protein